jgi:choline-glycine betaine transporter
MTEGRFFRRTALAAAAVVLVLVIWTSTGERVLPHILPFGEPWLTTLNVIGWWLLIVVMAHVIRWVYLGVSRRDPDLGH